jgi:hypothetical protein
MLTDKAIKDIAAPSKGSRIIYDTAANDDASKVVKGFGLRITAAGAKAFVLNYRFEGVERRYTIGRYPGWSVIKARKEAQALRVRIDQGEDPLANRIADRVAPTMRELAKRAVEDHFSKKRASTRYDVYGDGVGDDGRPVISGGQLEKWIIPALGSIKVVDIRPADIENLHRKVTQAGSPIRANRCVSTLSKMLALSIR